MFNISKPFVRITEQPISKALRFRYECEGRLGATILGASSTSDNKTFPSIQVIGCQGSRAVVVVSCVTKDAPFRPHPYNLVGRDDCKRGVCTLEIPRETMSITFSNLGIQCVKKKDIESSLRIREEIKVDPFLTGFNQRTSINLNAVRLCFQVFLEGERLGKYTVPLDPVVSEPIYNKKANSDLLIVKLSHYASYVDGGRNDIILLCEKVIKEDIQVRFFEEIDGRIVWEANGEFQPSQVHRQTAIWFKAPKYRTMDVSQPVRVFVQLRRPSDGATSEALSFEMLPLNSEFRKRKIQNFHDPNNVARKNIPFDPNIPLDSSVQIERSTEQNSFGQQQTFFSPIPTNYQLSSASRIPLFFPENNNWRPTNNLNLQINNNLMQLHPNQELEELQQIEVNSDDLTTSVDMAALSETFGQSLSLTDINKAVHDIYA